jgi:DNA invertase Pin-like site-specific DNA recombinase
VKIGYARVSTEEQSLGLQRHALTRADVTHVFEDYMTVASKYRPGLDAAMAMLGVGDTLDVGRSTLYRALRADGAPA